MKQVTIYQMRSQERDPELMQKFESWERNSSKFDITQYDKTWSGKREDDYTLSECYAEFNFIHPAGFKGHSLSVSDVVMVGNELWYCDSAGWVDISKDKSLISLLWLNN